MKEIARRRGVALAALLAVATISLAGCRVPDGQPELIAAAAEDFDTESFQPVICDFGWSPQGIFSDATWGHVYWYEGDVREAARDRLVGLGYEVQDVYEGDTSGNVGLYAGEVAASVWYNAAAEFEWAGDASCGEVPAAGLTSVTFETS